eukprot:c8810_g1_i1.p1 GENE.c8810_g1_i1~~c8810_g1_i1.p1  ORF type:complete len:149 (+),score=32.39 c8810_g1_i1:92-538(+)
MGMDESPFFNERYRNEFEAWRDAVSLTQGALRSDFETKPAFIPGVGYMRPFIRYAAFIPPADPTAKPVFTGETEANLKTMHDKFKQIAQTSAALVLDVPPIQTTKKKQKKKLPGVSGIYLFIYFEFDCESESFGARTFDIAVGFECEF